MNLNLSEINWDPESSGTWPTPVKAMVTGIVCLMVAGVWVYLDTLGQIEVFEAAVQKEVTLKQEFEQKHKKAVNLENYEIQLAQIETELFEMIRQMPTREEVASLLIDISQMGMATGLEFRLFKPQPAVQKEFYSELPINIEVIGEYDALGVFVSGLAALPRIVTVHDVKIVPADDEPKAKPEKDKAKTKSGDLIMTATIKTYNESQAAAPASKANAKRVVK